MKTKEQDQKLSPIGTICQPVSRFDTLAKAIGSRFCRQVDVARWRNHGGWEMANLAVVGPASKREEADIRVFAEGFLAALGGRFE